MKISDIPFKFVLDDPSLTTFYKQYIQAPTENAIEVEVDEGLYEIVGEEQTSELESYWQCLLVSDELMKHEKMIFHGCAFLWRGKAYIFSGPSGAGKSTQYLLWKKLFGDEIKIINGDKPILDFASNEIIVRPSPWRGKEMLGQNISAPLCGIIYLHQAKENRIERIDPKHVTLEIFNQVLFTRPDEETIMAAAKLTERLLDSVKLWRLDNLGDEESANLCHSTLEGNL